LLGEIGETMKTMKTEGTPAQIKTVHLLNKFTSVKTSTNLLDINLKSPVYVFIYESSNYINFVVNTIL